MHNDYRRASLWVWVTGGALTLLMGCCGLSLSVVAVTPMDELAKAAGPAISQEQLEQITQIQPLLTPFIVVVVLVGLLPGLIYLISGFGVRHGSRVAIILTRVLMLAQLGLFCVLMAINLLGLVMQGDLLGLVFTLIVYGPVMWLLWTTQQRLRLSGSSISAHDDIRTDPWKQA